MFLFSVMSSTVFFGGDGDGSADVMVSFAFLFEVIKSSEKVVRSVKFISKIYAKMAVDARLDCFWISFAFLAKEFSRGKS